MTCFCARVRRDTLLAIPLLIIDQASWVSIDVYYGDKTLCSWWTFTSNLRAGPAATAGLSFQSMHLIYQFNGRKCHFSVNCRSEIVRLQVYSGHLSAPAYLKFKYTQWTEMPKFPKISSGNWKLFGWRIDSGIHTHAHDPASLGQECVFWVEVSCSGGYVQTVCWFRSKGEVPFLKSQYGICFSTLYSNVILYIVTH